MRIGITMGDPKGIGPEIIAKSWAMLSPEKRSMLRIYGDRTVLDKAAELAGIEFERKQIVTTSCIQPPIGSISDAEAAKITIQAIDAAVANVRAGIIDGIVTAPVNKFRAQRAVADFTGHTEYLAQSEKNCDVVMMFASSSSLRPESAESVRPLRIALATTHFAIRDVPKKLTVAGLLAVVGVFNNALKAYFGCKYPRIGVLALNPHAGDNGALGFEEERIIAPAIEQARAMGINCLGPLVIDTIFAKIHQLDFDGIVAMYHDQGIIPMKLMYGFDAVNITMGLPFIRTAPAHGTAEDIAWRGMASADGMLSAIAVAEQMVRKSVSEKK